MAASHSDGRSFDVVVVGNGVLGLSLALSLARKNIRVAVLGEPHRPWSASAAAGAMLGCFGEVTTTLLKSRYGRTKVDWAVRARKLWDGWLAALDSDLGGSRGGHVSSDAQGAGAAGGARVGAEDRADLRTAEGTVVLLNTVGVPGIDDVNYAAIRDQLASHGEPFEDIDPADIDWLDPDAGSRPLRALHIPGEHAVDATALLARLERAVVRLGGTLVTEPAVRLEHARDTVAGVLLASGRRLAARQVVLAAGSRSQDLLDTVPELAARIPRLISGYGVSALVRTEDGTGPRSVLRTPNRAFACGLHLVPRGAGQVYVGATNIISPEPVDTPVVRDVLFLLGCANRQVRRNLWASGLERVQVGNRPVALDGFPLLGPAGLAGLWLMTGTYRDGLHLSPLLAAELTRRILGEPGELDLDLFAPVRVPIQPMSREEVVETAVTHMLATGYEYDWNVPVEWPVIIENNLRPAYLRFAADIDPVFTPPPELLAASRIHPNLVKMLRDYYAASHLGA